MVFHQSEHLHDFTLKEISASIFVSIVACVLCYVVLYWLLDYIVAHRLALFDGFHTLSAVLFGYFFFKEALTPLMVIGGGLILGG